jgi:hypothetical protein
VDILLDEPTNDLDIDNLQDLNGSLEQFVGCAAMVSHHRGSSTMSCGSRDSLIPRRITLQKFGR